jgi:hypothetical protein
VSSFLNTPQTKVSQREKDAVTRASVQLCCQDLRPFEIVSGQGFIEYTQAILKIQHQHPNLLKAEDLLPHPTTVSRNTEKRASEVREELKTCLQEAYADGNQVNYTTDMWTDSYKQRSYLTLTAHWTTNDHILYSRVISTQEFSATEKKTGVNIRAALEEILKSMNVTDEQIGRSYFTTDRGANMIAALKDEKRVDCAAHIINTVLRNTFDEEKECPKEIGEMISASKGMVRYIKKSNIQHLLETCIVQSCDTRWNSTYLMLKSIKDSYDKIKEAFVLHAYPELHRLTAINRAILEEVVEFLEVNIVKNYINFKQLHYTE